MSAALVPAALPVTAGEAPELAVARADAETLLRGALAALDELVRAHPGDVTGQAHVFVMLGHLKGDLIGLTDTVMANLWEHMAAKQVVVDGLGVLERRTATSSTGWDQDWLWTWIAHSAAGRFLADAGTGELADEQTVGLVEAVVDAVVGEARAMQTPGAWRKTALRARDIDPDDVSTVTWGKRTVQFTPPSGGAYQ